MATTTTAAFDLKSTAWTLTVLRLQTADTAALARALAERFGDSPDLFDGDAVVIDLGPLRESGQCPDFVALLPLLRRIGMLPVGVQGGDAAQTAAARSAGLPEAMDAAPAAGRAEPSPAPREIIREVVREIEVVREVEVPREVPTPVPTLVVDKPLRSGQRVYARGGDLIVTAVVSFGAEVIADGNVHVYAPLRGRAIAGARGDTSARIWSTCLEPQLISVAGIYRTTETELPDNVRGKPACVRLDGERLIIEPVGQ